MAQPQRFRMEITAEHKLLDLHLKELWRYRDLIRLMVHRDFVAMYKQTILGPLWAILQPLLTTVVFTVIFGRLAKLTTADTPDAVQIPGFLFYMCGNILWSYFSTTLQDTSNTFLHNRATMGKVYYPPHGRTHCEGLFEPDRLRHTVRAVSAALAVLPAPW